MKKIINSTLAFILFVLLIGTAFQTSTLFGIMFIVGFFISVFNRSIEKKPLLPLFIFIGGLIIRYALGFFLPEVINSKTYIDLAVSGLLFILIIYVGFRIKKGKI
jgi:hypothetical protein